MASMTITSGVSGGAVSKTITATVTADNLNTIVTSIPNSANNRVTIALDFDNLVGYWISAPVAMTIYTNDVSGGTPTDTITLVANVPVFWVTGNPTGEITADITADIYVTNTSGAAADLTILVLQDPTP